MIMYICDVAILIPLPEPKWLMCVFMWSLSSVGLYIKLSLKTC